MKYSKSEHKKAKTFTKNELAKYAHYSFQEVSEFGIKKRLVIESPPGFEQFNFAMEVNNSDDGGLELSVFYHDLPPYGQVPSWSKEANGTEDITYGESSSRVWFVIDKNDKKEWSSFEIEDDWISSRGSRLIV